MTCMNVVSLLSLVGSLYDRVLIKRVWDDTECEIEEQQLDIEG